MEEKVFFRNGKGYNLAGTITTPAEKTKTAVLVCHGFTGGKDKHFIPELSEGLSKAGYTAFRFDFTGNGKSEGEFSEGTASQEVKDIRSAINFLEKRGYVSFGIIGHSMGGGVVVGAGAADKRLKAVCSIAPSTGYHAGRSVRRYGLANLFRLQFRGHFMYKKRDGSEFKITKAFVSDKKRSDFLKAAESLDAPLLIIHGTADKTVEFAEGIDLFYKARIPKEFMAIGGADHNFADETHRKAMVEAAVNFFIRHLNR